MHKLKNLRALAPLFSPSGQNFPTLQSNFKAACFTLGKFILGKSRKEALSGDELAVRPVDSQEDNFDASLNIAEKISILRPGLKPTLLDDMVRILRPRCVSMFKEVILPIYHAGIIQESSAAAKAPRDAKDQEDDFPGWVAKLSGNKRDGR